VFPDSHLWGSVETYKDTQKTYKQLQTLFLYFFVVWYGKRYRYVDHSTANSSKNGAPQYIYKYQRTANVLECGWRVWRASLQNHGASEREFESPRREKINSIDVGVLLQPRWHT
jgi:hypothetical protein